MLFPIFETRIKLRIRTDKSHVFIPLSRFYCTFAISPIWRSLSWIQNLKRTWFLLQYYVFKMLTYAYNTLVYKLYCSLLIDTKLLAIFFPFNGVLAHTFTSLQLSVSQGVEKFKRLNVCEMPFKRLQNERCIDSPIIYRNINYRTYMQSGRKCFNEFQTSSPTRW